MKLVRLAILVCTAIIVVLAVLAVSAASVFNSGIDVSKLSDKKISWGLGKARDDLNRPTDAVSAHERYRELGGMFLLEGMGERSICLSFDLGYENGFTPVILDALLDKNVKGVFFITLDYALEAPEVVRRIIDEGHILGNHTAKHPSLPDVSPQRAREEVARLHEHISQEYGYEMSYFRFPSGEFSEKTLALLSELGYTSMFWSFAYVDWLTNSQPDPDVSLKRILDAAHPDEIMLLHSVSSTNAAIMGRLIDGLREKGYSLVVPAQAAPPSLP